MSSNTTISADPYNTLSELCNKLPMNCRLIWQKKQVDTKKKKVWSECYDKPCRARGMKVGGKSGLGHYEVIDH